MIKLKTDEEMIQTGHHWLYLHAKAVQDELRTQWAHNAAVTAAAEAAFTVIDEVMSSYDEYEAPPQALTGAYLLLFSALNKAPAPETDDNGADLPL